jgi:hypothetical protein
LLEQIEHLDYDVFNNRIRLHRPERFLIAFSEWAKATGRQSDGETERQRDRETEGQRDRERER